MSPVERVSHDVMLVIVKHLTSCNDLYECKATGCISLVQYSLADMAYTAVTEKISILRASVKHTRHSETATLDPAIVVRRLSKVEEFASAMMEHRVMMEAMKQVRRRVNFDIVELR